MLQNVGFSHPKDGESSAAGFVCEIWIWVWISNACEVWGGSVWIWILLSLKETKTKGAVMCRLATQSGSHTYLVSLTLLWLTPI